MRGNSIAPLKTLARVAFISLCLANNCRAATKSYSYWDTFPETSGAWAHTFELPQFDPSLGELDSVRIQLTYDLTVSAELWNGGSEPVEVWFGVDAMLPLSLTRGLGSLTSSLATEAEHFSLKSGEIAMYGPRSATNTAEVVLAGDAANWFLGTNTLALSAQTFIWLCVDGGNGKVGASLDYTSGAVVRMDYFDTRPVPEPGLASLFVAGLVMWLSLRRFGFRVQRGGALIMIAWTTNALPGYEAEACLTRRRALHPGAGRGRVCAQHGADPG